MSTTTNDTATGFRIIRRTSESSRHGGFTGSAYLVWEDQHGSVTVICDSEYGVTVLGVHLEDRADIASALAILGGPAKPVMGNFPGWGLSGKEGINSSARVNPDRGEVARLCRVVRPLARRQYAAALRAQAQRIESGVPVKQAERVWEAPHLAAARAFLTRKSQPEWRMANAEEMEIQ
ncbi:MAG: hypothetical protein E6Q97_39440 [Desulfurellales bacterium]|nr:MAG: hypothetical protein E6Q97_39440 [Desulfurellales bacterium]